MGRSTVRPLLMEYLTDHVGEMLHARKIMEDLSLSKGQVQQGMLHFSHKGIVKIVITGNTWLYEPKVHEPPVSLSEFHFEDDPRLGEPLEVRGTANGEIKIGQMVETVDPFEFTPGDLMEVLKVLKDGKLLLQDCAGVLFTAVRLEVQ